jgi:hypothetical protein
MKEIVHALKEHAAGNNPRNAAAAQRALAALGEQETVEARAERLGLSPAAAAIVARAHAQRAGLSGEPTAFARRDSKTHTLTLGTRIETERRK